ncbi:MAG: Uncharacterized protein Athens101428_696 [Candidatus Berkelbacteria bacterium Athens1014_28]|uniref:PrgI family protein n=1 Tax=Candidatus Berkelbacteria bacterium Athens1014_28 TaxID=2017145 RepID=A0A554LKG9_9BACT|nr:MAG: Uncharacterized protein Athens101428_696 [Candidatus Berkelbacteria bacterium Athens1014_28]
MQFKVPQKIDIEDRIVGPMTMLQFVYAVLGGGTAYLVANTFSPPYNLIVAAPIALFTFCVIFVKINGRPFGHFFRNLIIYLFIPHTRIWHKGDSNIQVEIYQPKATEKIDPYAEKRRSAADIENLANVIDKRGRV